MSKPQENATAGTGRSRGARLARRSAAPRQARDTRMDGILDAAQAVFCGKGYEATVVAEVAARLGVVEGTVFKYFPTKRVLLLKVLERWYERLAADYARDLAGVEGARARLRLLVWRHVNTVRQDARLCQLMFREVRAGGDYRGSRLHQLNRRYAALLTAAIESGIAAGEFRNDVSPALLRDLVYGGIEHHAWHWFEGRGRLDVDGITDQIMAVLRDGIQAKARRAA